MAVVSNVYKSLQFGGVNSADYGIYITGEAVYNAPERTVEFISVPGRNGSIALDKGRFENIEVTYPAGTFGDDQQDFSEILSDFRNAVLSQVGYQRLTDSYHPDEYRLGVYSSGLEVASTNKANGTAGEFSLTFNCKPQRFLTSGETEVTVASGDTITNPTPFDSQPLLSVEGEGVISLPSANVAVLHRVVGDIVLLPARSETDTQYGTAYPSGDYVYDFFGKQIFDKNLINSQDPIYADYIDVTFYTDSYIYYPTAVSESSSTGTEGGLVDGDSTKATRSFTIRLTNPAQEYRGTSAQHTTVLNIKDFDSDVTEQFTFVIRFTYGSSGGVVAGTLPVIAEIAHPSSPTVTFIKATASMGPTYADSTITASGAVYIDCETGEAYTENDGSFVSANSSVSLGTDLPTLAPGANEITYDNTVTSLKITPRWWKI